MKILHYTHNLGSGGAEKLLSDILPLMKEKGHEVHFAYSNGTKNVPKFYNALVDGGIILHNFMTSFYSPLQVLKLIKLLRREKFDVVHAHLFPTQYWLAFASLFVASKTRFIKTEHSVFNERKNYKILRPLEKFVYSRYEKIIGITVQVSENISQWINADNVVTVPNGVNLAQVSLARNAAKDKDYRFINTDCYNILMVGRFDGGYQKDQVSLIKALKYLPNDVCLLLVGEGPGMTDVQKTANDLKLQDRVLFLGVRSDVYKLMNLVDLNVLSTNHEGLSGVTLESLASGKPFLGSDVEGVNNVVPDKTFLFPKQDPKGLAKKILTVKNNLSLQHELVKKALDHVKKYDISLMVEKYLEVYQNGRKD